MKHPRSAFGATPSRGRYQRPGKAGSAVALGLHRVMQPSLLKQCAMEIAK
ncbi:MAG: hypothetical protein Q8K91_04230 [Hylemonella sp.]|nr:hypothetical protein [Hylemonella sp.]